jgi:hypothetical protein
VWWLLHCGICFKQIGTDYHCVFSNVAQSPICTFCAAQIGVTVCTGAGAAYYVSEQSNKKTTELESLTNQRFCALQQNIDNACAADAERLTALKESMVESHNEMKESIGKTHDEVRNVGGAVMVSMALAAGLTLVSTFCDHQLISALTHRR